MLDERAMVVKVSNERLNRGDIVTTVGWGLAFQSGQPDELLKAELTVSDVDRAGGLTYTKVGRTQLGIPVDTCAGDSGGPLLAWRDDAWVLYATLQGGGYNCEKDKTSGDGVWNSLVAHSSWIHDFVGRQPQLVLSSTAGAAEYEGDLLGMYQELGTSKGRPFYKQRDTVGKIDYFLYFNGACGEGYVWFAGSRLGQCSKNAYLRNPGHTKVPPARGWEFLNTDLGLWQDDDHSFGLEWGGLEPCSEVEVATGGEVARLQGQASGSYFHTGSWAEGRPVYAKTVGTPGFLRLKDSHVGWEVAPTVSGNLSWISGGRGTLSPGDPAAGGSFRYRDDRQAWAYWHEERKEWRDSKGQITIICK